MFEDYASQKRIRRFKKDITVLQKGNITVKFVNDEKYFPAYEKIWKIAKGLDSSTILTVEIVFLSDEYISFILRFKDKFFTLNYSLESGFFEREKVVMKYAGISRKDVKKVLKKNSVKVHDIFLRMFLVNHGVGILCDDRGDKAVKIRH